MIRGNDIIRRFKFNHPMCLKIILIVFLMGFIVGSLSTAKIKSVNYTLTRSTKSALAIFFNAFAYNYWYFFLLWICGFFLFGFILIYIMVFLKGFSVGTICFLLLKTNGLVGIGDFLSIIFPEVLILIPIFLYLSYQAISNTFNQKLIYQNSSNSYINKLIFITCGIAFYAMIITIINNFIRI